MPPEEIIDLYDAHPDLTLARLRSITGWSISKLKTLLMGGAS